MIDTISNRTNLLGSFDSVAAGDRIVFLENNRNLGVKNGMLGTVENAEDGRIAAKLDGRAEGVSVSTNDYQAIDHGYATTIHKSQGATVDQVFVMASSTMDRHLTYVSMTRHRDGVQLYAGRDEFKDMESLSGRLSRAGTKESTLDYTGGKVPEGMEADVPDKADRLQEQLKPIKPGREALRVAVEKHAKQHDSSSKEKIRDRLRAIVEHDSGASSEVDKDNSKSIQERLRSLLNRDKTQEKAQTRGRSRSRSDRGGEFEL